MPGPKPSTPPTWPDTATIHDVLLLVKTNVPVLMEAFRIADYERDEELMGKVARDMRHLATRIDQFRRVRVRRWTAEDSAQTHTHKGTT